MNLNCKPGDLAIIVESEHRENIGRIVHIDRPYDLALDGAFRWAVSSVGSPLEGYDEASDRIIKTLCGAIEDYMLKPISGLPIDEETRDEVAA